VAPSGAASLLMAKFIFTPGVWYQHDSVVNKCLLELNSVSAFRGTLISSKSRVYLPKDGYLVALSVRRSVGFS